MPIVAVRRVNIVSTSTERAVAPPSIARVRLKPEDFPMPPVRRRLAIVRAAAEPVPVAQEPLAPEPIVEVPCAPSLDARLLPAKRRRKVATPDAPDPTIPREAPAPATVKPKRRRGHAKKDERGKWLPTGPGPGFASPPLHSRFDGKRKGPGRPKGSRSQSSIMKEALDAKRVVNENGKSKKYSNRELVTKLLVNTALDKKNFKDLSALQELATKLFPDEQPTQATSPLGRAGLDHSILEQLFAGLNLGEAMPGAVNPLADALRPSGAQDDPPEGAWEDEEEWDASDSSDDDLDDGR